MIKILKKLSRLLDRRQKSFMVLLVFMMLLGALLETASVTLIIPVISVVMDPEAVEGGKYTASLYRFMGMHSVKDFTIFVMTALVAAFVLKNLYLYIQQRVLYRFVYTNQFKTSERMMKNYIRRPYEFYLNADTAVIQRTITSDVNNMYALILSLLTLVSEVIVALFLITVLLIAEPLMTVVIAAVLLLTLFVIKLWLKPVMKKAGSDNQDYYASLFKWISETVTGIKDVKISGREAYFVDEYIKCGKGYVDAVQKYTLFSNIPRLIIETVCVAVMIFYMLALILSGRDMDNMMAVLSAFGVAVVRLMPCANRINNQINNISYFEPFLMGVTDNLKEETGDDVTDISDLKPVEEKLPVKDNVELEDISYHYPGSDKLIFDHASLTIPVGKSVGIVGSSGAGKSTVVDVLLGLLKMQEGSIKADGVSVMEKENYRRWLKNIGYIPQTIFMLDDTIRKNVAFGIAEDEISEERIYLRKHSWMNL